MFYDPNNSFQILAILVFDQQNGSSDMKTIPFRDMIINSDKWIDSHHPLNIRGTMLIPTITISYIFSSEELNIRKMMYSFILTQSKDFEKIEGHTDEYVDFLTTNIRVMLSAIAEDTDDDYLYDIGMLFENYGYDYLANESYLCYNVENGCLEEQFMQELWYEELR